ncbi:MAG: DUF3575 domain-containing protein [Porphyromonas sp.]|nr:DUF3575 domain-containing protein [Porphyromonas sp.]
MRKWAIMCLLLVASLTASGQKVGLKTNLANWALMGSPNAALEMRLGDKWTLDLGGAMNLWKFEEPKELRYWGVQPEFRYWFCETFNGAFLGLHGHGGQYNIGAWDIPLGRLTAFKDHRYEGNFYGAGLSLGYQWVLSPRWNLETSLGGGWARTDYRKYECATCGVQLDEDKYDYFGVTRATISLIYLIK